jgi:hypothetical protein
MDSRRIKKKEESDMAEIASLTTKLEDECHKTSDLEHKCKDWQTKYNELHEKYE